MTTAVTMNGGSLVHKDNTQQQHQQQQLRNNTNLDEYDEEEEDEDEEEEAEEMPLLNNDHSAPVAVRNHHHVPSVHQTAHLNGGNGIPVRLIQIPTTKGNLRKRSEGDEDEDDHEGGEVDPELGSNQRKSKLRYPKELKKTAVAAVFMMSSMITTGLSLALVHESMPADQPPLPDQILDRVTYQKWALFASERLIQIQTISALMVVIFHKHRFIVLRRCCLILGVLYFYRSVTMWVTALPKADPSYECAPKLNRTPTVGDVFHRVSQIVLGMGLSINGRHVFCGDFIYSGHTMIILMGHLVIRDYSPRRFLVLHWMTWIIALTSIMLLLLSRGHYTVDVIIAYFITTRGWALYHTLAQHIALKQASNLNHFSGFWWFAGFRWFEVNVKAGKLPNEYNLPLPSRLLKSLRNRLRTWPKSRRKVAGAIS